MRPFILASGSPRRRELLSKAGLKFEVVLPVVNESSSRVLSIGELTTFNATRKALAVSRSQRMAVVLGADTLVALNGQVIGKPADLEEAFTVLQRLSGREHQVCTSIYITCQEKRQIRSVSVVSHVRFRALDQPAIRAYLAKIDPLDKAGAYAAQGHGREVIRRIRGSYTNVVGLPMKETLAALAEFGIVL